MDITTTITTIIGITTPLIVWERIKSIEASGTITITLKLALIVVTLSSSVLVVTMLAVSRVVELVIVDAGVLRD